MAERVEVITAGVLAGVPHGFLGRRGGVSTGDVVGLNVGLGAGDDGDAVSENRRRAVAAVMPDARLTTVYQVHSPDCVVVTAPWADDARPQADAMVTNQPGLLLGIVTADCAPVLFVDHEARVIGAAHAGWKGAFGGVTDQTIAAMETLGASRDRIATAIGPCIAAASYEVDDRFMAQFCASDAASAAYFSAGQPGHWQFDLEAYVANRLKAAGLRRIERLGQDTYAHSARYFSFRRATHLGQSTYGRQFSLIGLPLEAAVESVMEPV